MKSIIVILSALFLLTMDAANAVPEGRGHMGREMMNYGPVYYGTDLSANPRLNLTAEQITQIQTIEERYAQEIKSIQAQLDSKGKALKSEWLQPTLDHSKIIALHGDVKKLRDRMWKKMEGHHTKVLNILTAEQRAHVQDDRPGRGFHKQAGFGR